MCCCMEERARRARRSGLRQEVIMWRIFFYLQKTILFWSSVCVYHPEDMKPVLMCPAGGATPLVPKRIPIPIPICKPMGKMIMTCEQLPDAFMVSSFTFSSAWHVL